MSTEFFNDQWRIPSSENQNKVSNFSMDFDGTNDKIEFGDVNNFERTNSFSGSCWVFYEGVTGASQYIISKFNSSNNKGYQFYLNSIGGLNFIIGPGPGGAVMQVATGVPQANTWNHFVFTYDGSSLRTGINIYVNGVIQTPFYAGASSITGTIKDASIPFQISGRSGTSANGVNGKIDQVSVFDYELSASQVSTLYGGGTAITNPMTISPKPISYYQLGDQSVDNGANYLVPNNSLSDYVFNFDGTNDYIDTPQINLGSTNTISFWINTTTTTQGAIFGDPNGFADYALFSQPSLNRTAFRLGNNDSGYYQIEVSAGLLNDGNWHHHCLTRDGITINYYIDGILQTNVINNTLNASAGMNTTIENIFAMPSASFKYSGKLSNVALWNTNLTSTQVETLYNNGAPNDISSLSPTAWYKLNAADTFDGSNWTINDYGSSGNDGTSSGMDSSNLVVSDLQQTSGYSPYALDFDGIDDYLDCGDSDTFSFGNSTTDSPFSISAWIYMNDATTFRIVSKAGTNGNEYFLSNGGDDKLNFILYDTFGSGNIRAKYDTALTSYEGQWIHIVGTYSGVNRQNGIELYLNGSLLTTLKVLNSPYTAMSNTTQPFEIGRSASSSYANGTFSNVSVFNIELSSPQVATLYNNGNPEASISHSPVSWWKLDNTTTGIQDSAGSNNGTNNGATEYAGFVNALGGESSGMDSSNLVVSDLQQTSGYSPYALDFDGVNDYLDCGNDSSLQITGAMTISYWVKGTSTTGAAGVGTLETVSNPGYLLGPNPAGTISFGVALTSSSLFFIPTTQQITTTEWHHIVGVYTPGVSMKIYIDGQLSKTETSNIPSSQYAGGNDFRIGYRTCCQIDGQISNVAIWNTDLSSSEITEIYNQGRPSNLHNFSGTAPVSWWQIGSNSSYNSGAWTCLDEIGTNNAVSAGSMTNSDIVDGPGYSASGLGSSSIDIVGDAPYSTANGLSENMDVLDRVTDVPS